MFILEWQKLVKEKPNSDAVLAAVIPVHAPHALPNLSNSMLEAVETLQTAMLSPEHLEGDSVSLTQENGAFLWKNSRVESVYLCKTGHEDMANWLQKRGLWENTSKLVFFVLKPFEFQSTYENVKCEPLLIRFHLSVKVDENGLDKMVNQLLRKKNTLDIGEIRSFFDATIEVSNLFSLLSTCSPEDIVQNTNYQKKIETQIGRNLTQEFCNNGLALEILQTEWTLKKPEKHEKVSVTLSHEDHNRVDTMTGKIERRRFQAPLDDLKSNYRDEKTETKPVSQPKDVEMPWPIMDDIRKKKNEEEKKIEKQEEKARESKRSPKEKADALPIRESLRLKDDPIEALLANKKK